MNKSKLEDKLKSLRILLKHLRNDYLLTKEEYEISRNKYIEILSEFREKNEALKNLQENLEKLVKERTSELEDINKKLEKEITERKKAEKSLKKAHDELEDRVKVRTIELSKTNIELIEEIMVRKKTEEALKESEKKFRTLFDTAGDAIFIYDLEGHFLEVNKLACERLGYSREELLQMTPVDIDAPEYAALFPENIKILQEKGHLFFETAHITKDGRRIPIELSAGIIEYLDISAILSIARDITERKKTEEKLNEYRKQLYQSERLAATGRLAASIAHEINNPLQAITMNLGFVKKALPDDFPEKESIEQVKIGANRIKNTVKQLLDLQRPKVMFKEQVDVNRVIEQTLDLLKNQLDINKTVVKKNLNSELPKIQGIVQELHQVFMNLIMNAGDAMEGGGVLNISTEVKDKKLKIVFKDSGCGISEEDIDHIFEPFFTTKTNMLGTGLGLSISKGIIESFGGEINVKSKAGRGATFVITLPIS